MIQCTWKCPPSQSVANNKTSKPYTSLCFLGAPNIQIYEIYLTTYEFLPTQGPKLSLERFLAHPDLSQEKSISPQLLLLDVMTTTCLFLRFCDTSIIDYTFSILNAQTFIFSPIFFQLNTLVTMLAILGGKVSNNHSL